MYREKIMDKNAIKKYAIFAREELIKRVSIKAEEYGVNADMSADPNATAVAERVLSNSEVVQRRALINAITDRGYNQVIEEIAYTWFNRFIALRFMEVNNYLPSKVRVFTNENNEFKPQIIDEALHMELEGLDKTKVIQLKEENKTDELYKYMLITQCNALHNCLPQMFQKLGDYTELLFPSNMLSDESVIGKLVSEIKELDFTEEVEILGWLYQYYNNEEKNKVINIYKGTVAKENIAVATQLFTTDWVVRYMVDNSLGKYWIERNPNSKLAEKLEYFVTPKEGKINYIEEVITPEELTFFEPCMGSGHVLVYAFNVLMEIYKETGYSDRDAALLILEKNLFGLDIDRRAYQLAYFALMMKARSYDRKFLTRGIEPQVYAPMNDTELEHFGSMYIVDELGDKPEQPKEITLFNHNWVEQLNNWNFKKLLTQKYSVVCTNPPYLNKYNPVLKKYIEEHYKEYGADLFSVFIYKCFDYCCHNGYTAFMTPNVWMFIKSYEKLREYILEEKSISSLIQIAKGAFYKEATVDVMSFVLQNNNNSSLGCYIRLENFKGDMDIQRLKTLEALADKDCGYYYEKSKEKFAKIPGSPIAYWISDRMFEIFEEGISMGEISKPRQGMATTNNNLFLRYWYEISENKMYTSANDKSEAISSKMKWFPYNKGGEFRKWYGNNEFVVNWHNDGEDIKKYLIGKNPNIPRSESLYFKECFSWSLISSAKAAFRYKPHGHIFDIAGMSCFSDDLLYYLLALANTDLVLKILEVLAPTINFQAGDIANIPVIVDEKNKDIVEKIVTQNINLVKIDWDNYEASWDFKRHPLINMEITGFDAQSSEKKEYMKCTFDDYTGICRERFNKLKANEEELNHIFSAIYGLQDELTSDVEDKDVTIRLADKTRDVKSFISYAIGCMFGRYSLDVEGLAFAGGEFDLSKYKTFDTDKDNIIPICDDEYFEDDIVGRFVEFVKSVYGKSTLEDNLDFIADALGGKGTSRESIRNYFMKDFFSDHCKIYQKRPIYWQFDSGKKNGFKALIYMHRYEPDTLARIRTDYIHEQQARYVTAISDVEHQLLSAEKSDKVRLTKRLKVLKDQDAELREYEAKIRNIADQMIEIDLDDGVKVNHAKFEGVVTKIK